MATLNFTIDEVWNILRENGLLPEKIQSIRMERDLLLVTVDLGLFSLDVKMRQESFALGVLRVAVALKSWAFNFAARSKLDKEIDEQIRPYPFIRREGKSLFIDLNQVLAGRVKGVAVKNFALQDGTVKVEF